MIMKTCFPDSHEPQCEKPEGYKHSTTCTCSLHLLKTLVNLASAATSEICPSIRHLFFFSICLLARFHRYVKTKSGFNLHLRRGGDVFLLLVYSKNKLEQVGNGPQDVAGQLHVTSTFALENNSYPWLQR